MKIKEVVLVATNAVPAENEGIPESVSDYEEVDDLRDRDSVTKKAQLAEILHLYDFDIDGRYLPKEHAIFKTFDEAASYQPVVVNGHPCEIPSIVLYDYFGGHTCMEMNAIAGDQVNLLAEEYQARSFEDGKKYIRLPLKWSLVRWIKPRPQLTPVGLIPSSWIVAKKFYEEHPDLFVDPSWFLGVCSPQTAIDYLFFDTSVLRTGLFVIFSPPYANLSESDHRPYQMAVLVERTAAEEAAFITQWNKKVSSPTFAAQLELNAKLKQREIDELKVKRSGTLDVMRQQIKKKSAMHSRTQESQQVDFKKMEKARSKYKVKLFTIKRSYLGDYELFGSRYSSLYDLVYRLSRSLSELPCRLKYCKMNRPSDFKVVLAACSSPSRNMPHLDYRALPMYCEQWAAKYYSQVIEPQSMEKFVTFATRTILNPGNELHKMIANKLKLSDADQDSASAAIERYNPKKGAADPNKVPPSDNLVLKTGKLSLEMDGLKYDITKPLGKGQFGCVYVGEFKIDNVLHKVAIKTQKLLDIEQEAKFPFLNEIETLMMTSHPNVVTFFGYSIDVLEKSALLVFELLSEGSLDKFCARINYELSPFEVIDFLAQIARGVGHLHTREPMIVHADLAARNVLVKEHPTDKSRMILKITDLGLSQNCPIDVHLAYKNPEKIPFKWLPPEVLKGQQVSWTTDVWSLGIVAHEFFGIGEPYGIMGPDKLIQFLQDGHRFERQPRMPHYIYSLVLRCQRLAPYERPTMSEIENTLYSFHMEYDMDHFDIIRERKILNEILDSEFAAQKKM